MNIRYDYEEFRFYQNYMDALFFAYRQRRLEASRDENLVGHLDQIIEIAEQARQIADHPEVRLALARAHYNRMLYYATGENPSRAPENRARLDASDRILAELLRGLVEEFRHPEVYRLAVLYYGREWQSLSGKPRRSSPEQIRLKELETLLRTLAPLYRRYNKIDDPDVLDLLQRLE